MEEDKKLSAEPFWIKHPDFKILIHECWTSDSCDLTNTIKNYQNKPIIWNKETFGNIFYQIKKKKTRPESQVFKKFKASTSTNQLLLLEKKFQSQLKQLLEQEESIWMIKSRIDWITLGD